MKKIAIKAYTELNLGDDLFIRILLERYNNIHFFLQSLNINKKPFIKYENLTINSYSLFEHYLSIASGKVFKKSKVNFPQMKTNKLNEKIEATVYIGGSIFMESLAWENTFEELKKEVESNDNYFIIGANFGPYKTNNFLNSYKELFMNMNDICFRDEISYNLFKDLPNIRKAPDVVFSLDPESVISIKNDNKYIVISAINLENRIDLKENIQEYESKLAELSDKFIDRGYKVILMSFCKFEGDERAISRIRKLVSSKNRHGVKIYNYRGDHDESLEILKSSSGVIATRFHAMILGWIFSKPVYPLIYSNKMLTVIKDTEFNGDYTDLKEIEKLNPKIVIQQLEENRIHNIVKEKEESILQFQGFDDWLYNR